MSNSIIAYEIAKSFIKEFRRFDYKFPSSKTIKKSKWWEYFLKTSEYSSIDEDWTPEIFVKCQFEKWGKIYPPQLYSKRAIDTYKEFKFRFLEKDSKEKQIISAMISTHKEIKNWCKKKNIEFDYYEFFNDDINQFKLKRNEFSSHYLSVCKPVYSLGLVDKEKLKMKRAYVHNNEKLKNTLMEAMNEFFY